MKTKSDAAEVLLENGWSYEEISQVLYDAYGGTPYRLPMVRKMDPEKARSVFNVWWGNHSHDGGEK